MLFVRTKSDKSSNINTVQCTNIQNVKCKGNGINSLIFISAYGCFFQIARFRRSQMAKIKSKQWKNIAKLSEPILIMVGVVLKLLL